MAKVLERWMVKSMGYVVKLTTADAGESLYDGTVFHDILCKYNIINSTKCPAPPRNPSTEVAAQSLDDLGLWFKLLGITHSKELLMSAAKKDSSACLRILFELFAKLTTQDNTHFLMKQKAAETQQATSGRFTVTKAAEPTKPLEHPPPYFHKEDPLRDKIGIVESYKAIKERMAKWSKAEMQRRRDVVKKWSERQTYIDSEFEQALEHSTPPEDPIDVFNRYLEATKPKEEFLIITNKEYVAYLRQKRKKTLTSYVLKSKMHDTLVHDLWADILDERDSELTEVFREILLQPCEYEKKLTVTLQKLHDNYKNFSEFSSYIDDLAEDEHSLAETLYQSNKKYRKEYVKDREMERVLELHKRLWDEKLRVKREHHKNYCGQTVVDLVNHAIKLSEFRNEFHEDPPQKTLDEWKALFFKELPVLREPRSFLDQLLEDATIEKPEILKATIEDMARQNVGEDGIPISQDAQQQFPGNADQPNTQNVLQPNQNHTADQIMEQDLTSHPESDWKVLMDFKSDAPSSTARLPYMIELQTPHQSRDKIMPVEEEKKKCEDDIECLHDRDVVDCVNNHNLRTYLNTVGPWDLKQWPQIWETVPFDEKLNVLGYVVHRLLDFKYPLPKGPKKPRLPNFQIKAILDKFSDPQVGYILECLRDLLAKEKVEVIDVSMPINYCLNVYKEEMEITEVGSVLKTTKSLKESSIGQTDEDQLMPYKRWDKRPPRYPEKPPRRSQDLLPPPSPPQSVGSRHGSAKSAKSSKSKAGGRKSMARKSVARKSQGGGSRKSVARKSKAGGARKSVARKSKAGGARKSVARKSKVGGRKSMGGQRKSMGGKKKREKAAGKKGSGGSHKRSFPAYIGMNKATQIPSLPDLRKRYKHSPAGKLGKVAFETLAQGKKINDALLGNMLIEYLKSLDDKKGFLLVNFPTSALQANIFEHQLGGLPVQYPTKTDSEVNLFRTSEVDDIYGHLRCFLDYEKLLFDYVKEPEPPPDPIEAILAREEEAKKEKEPERKGSAKSHGKRKSVARKSMSRKSVSRKSVARKSAAPRKSKTARKSVARKSVAAKSGGGKRKSTAGGSKGKTPEKGSKKSEEKNGEEVVEEPPAPPPPPPEEPPRPPLSLEQLNRFRISEIVPRPNKDLDDLLYGTTSYFTKYVHPMQMQALKKDQLELARVKKGPFDQDPAVMLVKEENKTYPFYKGLGLVTDFDYMRFDGETIKRLARVILGVVWDEDDMTRKPSIELFGLGNLEKVEQGPPGSDSSGSSRGSRVSFFETKKTPKFLSIENNRKTTYNKYIPIKPPPPPPPPPEPAPEEKPEETIDEERKGKGRKSKGSGGSRKSIKSRKSMSRKSVSRKSVARKSMKRKSTARKSKISQKRKSTAKRQSKAGSVKRKSVAGGGGKSKSREQSGQPEGENEPLVVLPPKPKPGEPDWIYVNQPLPYETGYTAASVWECAEYAYLENMEKIFYLLRLHDMKVLPYKEYVKASLQKAMTEESEKRHLVTNFQLMLNKVDDDYRHDDDMKHELFVRAKELYDMMNVVAMERRERALIKKAELIGQGWVANQVYTLANLYLSMMQVELDMYVDSLQVLNDYYMGIMGTIPKPEVQGRFSVVKNKMANEEEIVISRYSSTGGRRRRKTLSRTSLPPITLRHSLVIPMKIQHLLLTTDAGSSPDASPSPPEPNPTYPLISQVESLKAKIKDLNHTYQGIINDPDLGKELRGVKMGDWVKGPAEAAGKQLALQQPRAPSAAQGPDRRPSQRKSKAGGQRKSKAGGQRKSQAGKRKSQGGQRKSQAGKRKSQGGQRKSQAGKRKSQGGQRKSTASKRQSSVKRQSKVGGGGKKGGGKRTKKSPERKEDEPPDMVDVAKEEWAAAVDYASRRVEFRLQLIEARAKKDLDRVLDIMKELFHQYQAQVDEQLLKELGSIDECMYVFKRAIEDGSPIQPLVVLDDNKFYVDRKILLYPDPPPPPPLPLVETRNPYSFTVEQLTTLVNKFSQMAPMGTIETPMIHVLREMAIAGFESGKPTLPSAWAKLDSFDYKDIFTKAFGDQTCLDWRNFLINIADLPYPTIEQLQALKTAYSARDLKREVVVTRRDFDDIRLWFEDEFGDSIETDLKLSLAKPLIFNMFKINNDEMNYYDMLMGYCRAEDPEDGLGMALDLLQDSGFILPSEKCLREDEFDKIHPRKIVDFILVNFFTDLLNLTETVELKYLPRLTHKEVFASDGNEFEISEDILRQNKGTRKDYGDLSSTDSETNRPKPERVLYLDDDDEMPAKYCCEKWQMCVPYEIALALIMNALNYYALSPIHQHRILNIEQRLKDLYNERGTGTHIRAYRLTTSDLFKELYMTTNIFKKTNIIGMVETMLDSKKDNAGGKPASELAKD